MTDRKQDIVERGMLEKVARAIAINDGCSGGELDRIAGDERMDPMPTYRMNARAALMAMREPGWSMLKVGAAVMLDWESNGDLASEGAENVWTAMIDAILADAPPCPSAPGSVE